MRRAFDTPQRRIEYGQAEAIEPSIVHLIVAVVVVSVSMAGCASIVDPGSNSDGSTVSGSDAGMPGGIDVHLIDVPAHEVIYVPGCGSGIRDPGEACDDRNTRGGDGCSADCKTIDPDFGCPEPGKLCVYLIRCGDGLVGGVERCDPPNPGHGCSATCTLEPGYTCDPPATPPTPATPASCHKTVCGDGNKEGTEACDDSNSVDGDGCSAGCTLEPDCTAGTCTSKCGDGMKLAPEACDDGNTKDGDGCSHDCRNETGFTCRDATTMAPPSLNLLVTYRDFVSIPTAAGTRHPDFEIFAGMAPTPLLVKAALDATGKPVMEGRCTQAGVTAQCPYDQQLTSQASFSEWYHDTMGVNVPIVSALLLPRNGTGTYVYDSANQGFYPIDGKGWVVGATPRETVAIADATVNDGRSHNFGFTTEIRYFFQYRGGESLGFSGDDDVWIFVNRKLALDLGGLHARAEKTLSLDQSATALGLAVGGLYEIALFHAERHSAGSNFKLTLTGFAPTTSACQATCGDGVHASVEQCDDGNVADGDGCSHDCRYEDIGIE